MSTELTTMPQGNNHDTLAPNGLNDRYGILAYFKEKLRAADAYSRSNLVPDAFAAVTSKGVKNENAAANCLLVIDFAIETGVSLNTLFAWAYVVGNKLAFETKLCHTLLAKSRKIVGSPNYEIVNGTDENGKKDRGLRCWVKERETGEIKEHTLYWSDVVKSGWSNNPAWKKNRLVMMKYRCLMQLIRHQWPEVIGGVITKEEAEDITQSDPETASMADFYEGRRLTVEKTLDEEWEDAVAEMAEGCPTDDELSAFAASLANATTIAEANAAGDKWREQWADKEEYLFEIDVAVQERCREIIAATAAKDTKEAFTLK